MSITANWGKQTTCTLILAKSRSLTELELATIGLKAPVCHWSHPCMVHGNGSLEPRLSSSFSSLTVQATKSWTRAWVRGLEYQSEEQVHVHSLLAKGNALGWYIYTRALGLQSEHSPGSRPQPALHQQRR